ncbi:MAG: DUF924 family protein [Pseudomonadota bacterium]
MQETLSQADSANIHNILELWFKERENSAPGLDSRMNFWFGDDPETDIQIRHRFGKIIKQAADGELDHWTKTPLGRLALILVLDQFRRNVYRGKPEAFSHDKAALKLCVEGAIAKHDKQLSAIQQIFFFMPMQHVESLKVQEKSVAVFRTLVKKANPSERETLETCADFAELHRDIIEQFGRFPHRNAILGRESTETEKAFLSDGPTFGQA